MKLLLLGRVQIKVILNLFGLGLLRVAGWLEGEGGGGSARGQITPKLLVIIK